MVWHAARHLHGGSHSLTRSLYHRYTATCHSACRSFAINLPGLLKNDPTTYYDVIHPWRGPKSPAGCTTEDWEEQCRCVFDLPAQVPMEITPHPDPTHLPFMAEDIRSALQVFKGNKSSGPSFLPSQLVKHLHGQNDMVISELFKHFAEHGIPKAWNLVQVTPVHKRGNQADAKKLSPCQRYGAACKILCWLFKFRAGD